MVKSKRYDRYYSVGKKANKHNAAGSRKPESWRGSAARSCNEREDV